MSTLCVLQYGLEERGQQPSGSGAQLAMGRAWMMTAEEAGIHILTA